MNMSIYLSQLFKNDIFFNIQMWAIIAACSFITSHDVLAQTNSLDNKKQKHNFSKKKEIENLKINEDAIKLIKFDFMPSLENDKPMDSPIEKSWMKFKKDFAIPKNLTDTAKVRKREGYIRMLPYTIWTKFGENPVYDIMVFGRKKEYKMTFTLNPFREFEENYGLSIAPSAGMISSGLRTRGAGIAIGNLDIIGFIYNNFTKRGRMLQHNKKHANAWKKYGSYQPTLSDSLKLPTFYLGLDGPVFDYNTKDSVHVASSNFVPFDELPDSVREEIEEVIALKKDSLIDIYLENENIKADKERKAKRVKRNTNRKLKAAVKARKEKEKKERLNMMEEKMREELPTSMDSIYRFMREKELREAEEREKIRKEREFEID